MDQRLRKAVELKVTKEGPEAYSTLGGTIGKSPKTIRRWMKEGIPSPHFAYLLAKACGAKEEDALSMAESSSPESREIA